MPFIRTLICLLCLALVSACSREPKEKHLDGKTVRVQVPFMIDGGYSLQIIELVTLENLPALKGLAAKFLIDPDSANNRLTGRSPNLRYIRDADGVIVPTDAMSLQLLSVYAHFEKLREMDEKLGAKGLLKYPRVVAINTQLRDAHGDLILDNALYSGQLEAFLMTPYTREELPLMANGGVIGHEHFHAIFQELFVKPLGNKYPDPQKATVHNDSKLAAAMGLKPITNKNFYRRGRKFNSSSPGQPLTPEERVIYHATLLRGINEGFADVWGWVYTGDTTFVGRSLHEYKAARDFRGAPDIIRDGGELKMAVKDRVPEDELITDYSYPIGTELARLIYNLTGRQAQRKNAKINELRSHVGEALVKALPALQKDFASLKDDELYTVSRALAVFAQNFKGVNSKDCQFVLQYMTPSDLEQNRWQAECQKLGKGEAENESEKKPETNPEAKPEESPAVEAPIT